MSKLETNTASLQTILNTVNSLPSAGSGTTEDLSSEITTQDALLSELEDVLANKASGGSGGSSSDVCQIATGSFTSNGSQKTLQIDNLTFKPSSILIEARTKVGSYAGSNNICTLGVGQLFNTRSTYKSSTSTTNIGSATSYVTVEYFNGGFNLTLTSGVFGQATYYWTAIGGTAQQVGPGGSSGGSAD
jgi:hypothetical protein